ncbi:P22 phage major capsid protein family protein [Microbacterium jejuense]|uniref:P22 phage major capsid protein family protein n=1 Tax=Microbacterium jejuense TaxID=1263637 RepID=UPI0031E567C0
MAVTNFIPEIWSDQLLDRWEAEAVFPQLVSRKYEGDARKGNVVHLTGVVAPTIKNYKTGVVSDGASGTIARTTAPDEISDTGVDLLIDQEKSFDFKVHDIDRVQAAGSFQDYTDAAGDALAADSDSFIAAMLATNGTAMTAAAVTTGDAAWDQIVTARKLLQKAKVPASNRILAINPEFEELLLKASSKLTSFNTAGDTDGLRNATLGNILGFRVVSALSIPDSSSKPRFIAFHQSAAAYVSQIDEIEGMRDQNSFADRVRGLHVYGGKVVKATGVRVFTAS